MLSNLFSVWSLSRRGRIRGRKNLRGIRSTFGITFSLSARLLLTSSSVVYFIRRMILFGGSWSRLTRRGALRNTFFWVCRGMRSREGLAKITGSESLLWTGFLISQPVYWLWMRRRGMNSTTRLRRTSLTLKVIHYNRLIKVRISICRSFVLT